MITHIVLSDIHVQDVHPSLNTLKMSNTVLDYNDNQTTLFNSLRLHYNYIYILKKMTVDVCDIIYEFIYEQLGFDYNFWVQLDANVILKVSDISVSPHTFT